MKSGQTSRAKRNACQLYVGRKFFQAPTSNPSHSDQNGIEKPSETETKNMCFSSLEYIPIFHSSVCGGLRSLNCSYITSKGLDLTLLGCESLNWTVERNRHEMPQKSPLDLQESELDWCARYFSILEVLVYLM